MRYLKLSFGCNLWCVSSVCFRLTEAAWSSATLTSQWPHVAEVTKKHSANEASGVPRLLACEWQRLQPTQWTYSIKARRKLPTTPRKSRCSCLLLQPGFLELSRLVDWKANASKPGKQSRSNNERPFMTYPGTGSHPGGMLMGFMPR